MLKVFVIGGALAGAFIGALAAPDRFVGAQIGGFAGALVPVAVRLLWLGLCRLLGLSI